MTDSMQARSKNWSRCANVGYRGKMPLKESIMIYHILDSTLQSFCARSSTPSLCRMPVQYIIGEWDFRDITVKLVPPIFIPRPETEILVDYLLKRLNSSQLDSCEILEIGCGSGAISLALAHACKKVYITCYGVIVIFYVLLNQSIINII